MPMLASEPPEPPSNWDLSPVLDLLRSPAVSFVSPTSNRSQSAIPPSSPNGGPRQHGGDGAHSPPTALKLSRSYTKLGDFGSVWNVLSSESTWMNNNAPADPITDNSANPDSPREHRASITVLQEPSGAASCIEEFHTESAHSPCKAVSVPEASKTRALKKNIVGHATRSSAQPHTITILKRAEDKTHSTVPTTLPPRTPLKPIPRSGNSLETPKPKVKAGWKDTKPAANGEPLQSESSAEPDSDSSAVVFDLPSRPKLGALGFVPSQVGTPDAQTAHYDTPPSSFDDKDSGFNSDVIQTILNSSGPVRVESTKYKNATERRVFLMTKLLKDFPEYAQLVSQMGRPTVTHKSVESRPVHVFVDMSNVRLGHLFISLCPFKLTCLRQIMVGFHDSVKVSRNIPITTRIRRLHMSFTNFSLIMERGRPTAKRVLVGSDRLPAINEAEKLGYEANILDRVHKVKHATSRQAKLQRANGLGSHSASLGPETVGAERWVEQGVDEILHLKILESLVDAAQPATIVLATGDAAEAEYSGGFMRMIERALGRGWNVELVSFSQVTSNAYRKKEFREKWGWRFRIIELDTYVEELFV
ncbi:uncharacterized protein N7459_009973 [Penicillium hispanicum]|uniref:uncharacterized protein n=1 Tax=Penicillium hispanicum TaxID=1080232 RepID=UPI0025416B07|nr:uncharacterized protein N7459_009973 [Penicillium hispanicum]KAJ5570543.1 hypothetical protein N7459_009973 [Penicillium hispanicum]